MDESLLVVTDLPIREIGEALFQGVTRAGANAMLMVIQPTGEAYVAPVEGTASGEMVFDGSIAGIGSPQTPVTVRLEKGLLVDADGPDGRRLPVRIRTAAACWLLYASDSRTRYGSPPVSSSGIAMSEQLAGGGPATTAGGSGGVGVKSRVTCRGS
ncbi:MAG: hypothetical protein ACYC66_00270 [Chloroflexota bacterium]